MPVQSSVSDLVPDHNDMELTIQVMYFEAYPLIFQGIYGMSDGIAGLAFIPSKMHLSPRIIILSWPS